jgi:hypothetical protein
MEMDELMENRCQIKRASPLQRGDDHKNVKYGQL